MSAKTKLLDAAASLCIKEGVTALGVEQVVRTARVSKGSFFYHFVTKDEMVRELLDHVAAKCGAEVDNAVAGGARFTDALIDMIEREARENGALIHVLVASVALDPTLRETLTKRGAEWRRRMIEEDGLKPEFADRLRLAIDGFMISAVLYDRTSETTPNSARAGVLRTMVKEAFA